MTCHFDKYIGKHYRVDGLGRALLGNDRDHEIKKHIKGVLDCREIPIDIGGH